jgi:hypothetical protein
MASRPPGGDPPAQRPQSHLQDGRLIGHLLDVSCTTELVAASRSFCERQEHKDPVTR